MGRPPLRGNKTAAYKTAAFLLKQERRWHTHMRGLRAAAAKWLTDAAAEERKGLQKRRMTSQGFETPGSRRWQETKQGKIGGLGGRGKRGGKKETMGLRPSGETRLEKER